MLLKYLFTLLAILWLFQAARDLLGLRAPVRRDPPYSPPPPDPFRSNMQYRSTSAPPPQRTPPPSDDEYIDFEEIKPSK